jgi:hypothetical protein
MFANLLQKFSQSLILNPSNFLLVLGVAPSHYISKILVSFGFLLVNVRASNVIKTYIKPKDILQFTLPLLKLLQKSMLYLQFRGIKTRLMSLHFLQADLALYVFTLIY